MALTATAQSALPREPTWDNVIVPALRQRLRNESNALAKRISAASITSVEESMEAYRVMQRYNSSPPQQNGASKPSNIPRPSLQQTRTSDGPSTPQRTPEFQRERSRTISQPYLFDSPKPATSSTMTDTSQRSISPTTPKGTRLPVPRPREGSSSTQGHSSQHHGSTGKTNGLPKQNGDADLWRVDEQAHSQTSRSTIRIPRHKVSEIFAEPSPFPSSSHSQLDHDGYSQGRLSSDSEEHPYEHWYRGDVARNGGVGELRVGRRQEMLDIANYGHKLRGATAKSLATSRSSSRAFDYAENARRSRAGSVGARQSIYLDDDEEARQAAMVLDEPPLTDFENDHSDDHADYGYGASPHVFPLPSASTPSLDRSGTPTSRSAAATPSRIPAPSRRAATPSSQTQASASAKSTPQIASTSSPQMVRSPSAPLTQSTSPATPDTAKRRAKSPASAASPSSSKKAKPKAPPSSMARKPLARNNEDNRRSIGQYPLPDGGEDAIPSWTQPVQATGNWDDVVLPVVARKKGLEGHYETADGSPRPPQPEPVVYEPAPGTFGYDHTKAARWRRDPESIPMDEFGQRPDEEMPQQHEPQRLVVEEQPSPVQAPASPLPRSPRATTRTAPTSRDSSPPPFARYDNGSVPLPLALELQRPPKQEVVVEEDAGGGCCKCVIM